MPGPAHERCALRLGRAGRLGCTRARRHRLRRAVGRASGSLEPMGAALALRHAHRIYVLQARQIERRCPGVRKSAGRCNACLRAPPGSAVVQRMRMVERGTRDGLPSRVAPPVVLSCPAAVSLAMWVCHACSLQPRPCLAAASSRSSTLAATRAATLVAGRLASKKVAPTSASMRVPMHSTSPPSCYPTAARSVSLAIGSGLPMILRVGFSRLCMTAPATCGTSF